MRGMAAVVVSGMAVCAATLATVSDTLRIRAVGTVLAIGLVFVAGGLLATTIARVHASARHDHD